MQDRGIPTNSKSYTLYRLAPLLMTLNSLQGHFGYSAL